MEVQNIVFDGTTSSLGMTFVPNPAVPNEVALMGCAYAILMAYPNDQVTAAKYIFGVYRVLGFGVLPPQQPGDDVEALKADQKVMDAIRHTMPQVADAIMRWAEPEQP